MSQDRCSHEQPSSTPGMFTDLNALLGQIVHNAAAVTRNPDLITHAALWFVRETRLDESVCTPIIHAALEELHNPWRRDVAAVPCPEARYRRLDDRAIIQRLADGTYVADTLTGDGMHWERMVMDSLSDLEARGMTWSELV